MRAPFDDADVALSDAVLTLIAIAAYAAFVFWLFGAL